MKKLLLLVLVIFFSCSKKTIDDSPSIKKEFSLKKELSTIAFGSCNDQNKSQNMWQYIIANQPDMWIWLGDNIYGDTEDMSVMAQKYHLQKSNKDYQKLRALCPILGIWDDHDYGENDAGINFPKKEESKKLMLDFLDVDANATVRKQQHGAYQSYTYGPKEKEVKIILLDARYFRSDLKEDPHPDRRYQAKESGDILGEEQWAWLEKELTNSTAKVHVIGSGIQIIPEQHGWEKWANFPKERKRLFDLFVKTKPRNPVLISGDRHIAELSKFQPEGLPYPIYEMTSSSLTHGWGNRRPELNKHRVGEIVYDRNFALLHIDWQKNNPRLTLEVKGLDNESFLKKVLEY